MLQTHCKRVWYPNLALARCTLGLPCDVRVRGYRVAATSAVVALSSGTCGAADATVATETWAASGGTPCKGARWMARRQLDLPYEGT